jgi:hypothetical protein
MEKQQILEMLKAMQEVKKADRKAYHKEMIAMLDAHHERMMACLGKMEADTEKIEHQENPKEEATVMPVGEPRTQHRVCNLATERCQRREERTGGNC